MPNHRPAPHPNRHPLHPSVQVCDYVRVFDEDEGCGVEEDSQKLSANSAGHLGKTTLKDDIYNDAACFDVYLT